MSDKKPFVCRSCAETAARIEELEAQLALARTSIERLRFVCHDDKDCPHCTCIESDVTDILREYDEAREKGGESDE